MKQDLNDRNSESPGSTRRPLGWCCLPLCLAILWVGCQRESKVAADTALAGTYTLVSVNGNTVPCAVKHDGGGVNVKSGTFVIHPDGTCSSRMTFTTPAGTDATREVKAAYTQEGSNLTMKWEGTGMTAGKVEGNTFTMDNEGMVLAYRK